MTTEKKIYNITEMFLTLQGEGFHAGVKSLFIRFQHCNLKCSFCDTDFSYSDYNVGLTKLVFHIKEFYNNSPSGFKHIVLTGGEPLMQVDKKLVEKLIGLGFTVQIETNGTMPAPFMDELALKGLDLNIYITCSPKKKVIDKQLEKHIKELKIVLFNKAFAEDIVSKYSNLPKNPQIYIQPCERNGKMNLKETYNFIMRNKKDLKMSIQTQKIGNFE